MKIIKEEKKEYYELKPIEELVDICICFHEEVGGKIEEIEKNRRHIKNYAELFVELYNTIIDILHASCLSEIERYIISFFDTARYEKLCSQRILSNIGEALFTLKDIYEHYNTFNCNKDTLVSRELLQDIKEDSIIGSFYTKKNKQVVTIGPK